MNRIGVRRLPVKAGRARAQEALSVCGRSFSVQAKIA